MSELILDVLSHERTVHARVTVENEKLLGFIHAHSYSIAPINDAIRRLTSEGDWHLWATDLQVKIAELGRPKDFESPLKRHLRIPLDKDWLEQDGLAGLSGEYFFLTRGEGVLEIADEQPEPSPRKLPSGTTAFVAFDPDVEWFDAVFSEEWFDQAVALLSVDGRPHA
ncbi:MAG: hypothetical protein ACYDHQ_06600 [Coriobacteriia bacterium]